MATEKNPNNDFLNLAFYGKELKMQEEHSYFSFPLESRFNSKRWTSIDDYQPDSKNGPWIIEKRKIKSSDFLSGISPECSQIFLGGLSWFWPGEFSRRNNRGTWCPLLIRMVKLSHSSNGVKVEPLEDRWNLSPLFVSFLQGLKPESGAFIEEVVKFVLKELRENSRLIDFARFQEQLRKRALEEGIKIFPEVPETLKSPPTPWVLFKPPEKTLLRKSTIRDYEKMEWELKKNQRKIGALRVLLEDERKEFPSVSVKNDKEIESKKSLFAKEKIIVEGDLPDKKKAEIIAFSLIDSWIKKEKILFVSRNDSLTDLVEDKVKKLFGGFPAVVRTGSKRKNNIGEIFGEFDEILLKIKEEQNFEGSLGKKEILTEQLKNLDFFLEEGKDESKEKFHEAKKRFNRVVQLKENIKKEEEAKKNKIKELGYSVLPGDFKEEVLVPLTQWLGQASYFEEKIREMQAKKQELNQKFSETQKEIKDYFQKSKIQMMDLPYLLEQEEKTIERIKNWVEEFRKEIKKYEKDFYNVRWDKEFDKWKNSKNVKKWLENANKFLNELDGYKESWEKRMSVFRQEEKALGEKEKGIDPLLFAGGQKPDLKNVKNWIKEYTKIEKKEKEANNPLERMSLWAIEKKVQFSEKRIINFFPEDSFPREKGRIKNSYRKTFLELMEKIVSYREQEIKVKGILEEISSIIKKIKKRELKLGIFEEEVNSGEDFAVRKERTKTAIEVAEKACGAWEKKEELEKHLETLDNLVLELEEIILSSPTFKTLLENQAENFYKGVKEVKQNWNYEDLSKVRKEVEKEVLEGIILRLEKIHELMKRENQIKKEISGLPNPDIFVDEFWIKQPKVAANISREDEIPKIVLSKHVQICEDLDLEIEGFFTAQKPFMEKIISENSEETKKLVNEALSYLPENDVIKSLKKGIKQKVSNELIEWPESQIQSIFDNINEKDIQKEIKELSTEIDNLYFPAAIENWVFSLTSDLQESIKKLDGIYKKYWGVLPRKHKGLFKKVLQVFPVWVANPAYPNWYPAEAELFDRLVIDNGAQEVLMDFLPYFFRAKNVIIWGNEGKKSPKRLLNSENEETIREGFLFPDDFLGINFSGESFLELFLSSRVKD